MAKVVMYTTQVCPYCVRAKMLLDQLGVAVEEIRVDTDMEQRTKMMELTGRRTVPQIVIDDEPIGGCDDLYELHRQGKLEPMLAS